MIIMTTRGEKRWHVQEKERIVNEKLSRQEKKNSALNYPRPRPRPLSPPQDAETAVTEAAADDLRSLRPRSRK